MIEERVLAAVKRCTGTWCHITGAGFGYDADGNLTSDGRWTNTWNAENRLTQMESLSTAPAASKRRKPRRDC